MDSSLAFQLRCLVELAVAFALALPIAWDRERRDRSLGLRTFPLISTAACAFMNLAQAASPEGGEWNKTLEGIAVGVGFLGSGAIVKHGLGVVGSATAAGVWMTAAMGAACAFEQWVVAVTLSLVGFGTLHIFRRVTPKGDSQDRVDAMKEKSAGAPEPDSDESDGPERR